MVPGALFTSTKRPGRASAKSRLNTADPVIEVEGMGDKNVRVSPVTDG